MTLSGERRERIDPDEELRLALKHLAGWAQGLTDADRARIRGLRFEVDRPAFKTTVTLLMREEGEQAP